MTFVQIGSPSRTEIARYHDLIHEVESEADRINRKFGRHAVSLGPLHGGRIDRIGSKIAFGRIPEFDEFHE